MARFTFIMEQTLGHVVHTHYLQNASAGIQYSNHSFNWLPIAFNAEDRFELMPVASNNWTVRGSLRARTALKRSVINQPQPDALFVHTQTISQLCTPYFRQIPSIISLDATPENIQEMAADYGQPASAGLADALKKQILMRAFHSARLLVCWSSWAATSLESSYGIPSSRIRVIPAGVDTSQFAPTDRSERSGPVRLLFVGGDFNRKGGPELIQAFASLRKSGVPVELDLVCPAPPELGGETGITVYKSAAPGSNQMQALYAAADVFVLPSRGDCLPLAILEAMACGLPVVASNVGAIKEAVQPGINGCLCSPRNAEALRAALENYLASARLRWDHGTRSRQIAVSSFDASQGFQQIVDCLLEVCAGN